MRRFLRASFLTLSIVTASFASTPSNEIVNSNNRFAFNIYKQINHKNQNFFFSPYSISSALGMTYEGAKNDTADEMQKVMHLPHDKEIVRYGYKDINTELNTPKYYEEYDYEKKTLFEKKAYELNVANALWVNKNFELNPEYKNNVENYYGAKANSIDLSKASEARYTINSWIEDKTNNKIKDLIPDGAITPLTKLILTNAIYFKSAWESHFEDSLTKEKDFTSSSGEKIKTYMMQDTMHYKYGEDEDMQIVQKEYKNGTISMLIVLPKNNDISTLETKLTHESLDAMIKKMNFDNEVILSLPKFKIESSYNLNDTLIALGMKKAFDMNKADFSLMAKEQLHIAKVLHKAFIDVDEEGSEAAAATAIMMATRCVPIKTHKPEPKIFNANHPFIFFIQENKTGNILFMGKIEKP